MKPTLALLPCLALCALCALVLNTGVARAEDLATQGRALFNKYRTAVVTVQLVVKSKMNIPGLGGGGGAHESREETTGVLLDPAGLTVVSLSSVDPAGMLQGLLAGMGGDDDGGGDFKMKMESEVTDVKILDHEGTELPAEIVLRDKDLDLAFIRPKAKPATPLPALDFSPANTAPVDVLDEVITINRLGKVAGRTHAASIERIAAVVKKPRLFYVPGASETATSMGCPAFRPDGKLVGIFVVRSLKSGSGGIAALAGGGPPITPILLPAEDVRKIAAQVPPPGDAK